MGCGNHLALLARCVCDALWCVTAAAFRRQCLIRIQEPSLSNLPGCRCELSVSPGGNTGQFLIWHSARVSRSQAGVFFLEGGREMRVNQIFLSSTVTALTIVCPTSNFVRRQLAPSFPHWGRCRQSKCASFPGISGSLEDTVDLYGLTPAPLASVGSAGGSAIYLVKHRVK